MKKLMFLFLVFAIAISTDSCKKDEISVNDEGLTQDIVNLVPENILNEMKTMGMPLYGGENPPNVENAYIASLFFFENKQF